MGIWSPEQAIAMEERHIIEGEVRVARQEALVVKLIEKGHGRLLAAAEDLLVTLRESVELSRERLLWLTNRYGNPPHSQSQY